METAGKEVGGWEDGCAGDGLGLGSWWARKYILERVLVEEISLI